MGATYGRALQAIVRPVSSESPHKLPSENFDLAHPELGEEMASLPQLGAGRADEAPGTWQQLLSFWASPIQGTPGVCRGRALLPALCRLISSAPPRSSLQALTSQPASHSGADGRLSGADQWEAFRQE